MWINMTPPYSNPFPAAGTLVSTFCSGTTKMGRYNNGSGGTYDAVIQTNSTECGYVAPPANGTLLSTFCSGTTKMGRYANGSGGTYDAVIANNSTECGYQPGLEGGGGVLRVNIAWDGACDVDIIVTAPDGYKYGYAQGGGGTGVWDHDSTNAGQENVAWNPTCPLGQYSIQLKNFNGQPPGTITVTVIYNGVTKTTNMTGLLAATSGALSSKNTVFTINATAFTQNPVLA